MTNDLTKQLSLIMILGATITFGINQFRTLLHFLWDTNHYVETKLTQFIPAGFMSEALGLLLVAGALAAVPIIFYKFIFKKPLPLALELYTVLLLLTASAIALR